MKYDKQTIIITITLINYQYILKQKSLATQNLVGILFIIKIPSLKLD